MKRRLIIVLAAASLLLCLATAALWVRSYWARDSLNIPPSQWLWASSDSGRIGIIVDITWGSNDEFHYESYFGYLRVTILFALLSFLFSIQILLRKKTGSNGFCVRCGYDLRATPDRCPECGARPENLV
jgi:hypothetical protein